MNYEDIKKQYKYIRNDCLRVIIGRECILSIKSAFEDVYVVNEKYPLNEIQRSLVDQRIIILARLWEKTRKNGRLLTLPRLIQWLENPHNFETIKREQCKHPSDSNNCNLDEALKKVIAQKNMILNSDALARFEKNRNKKVAHRNVKFVLNRDVKEYFDSVITEYYHNYLIDETIEIINHLDAVFESEKSNITKLVQELSSKGSDAIWKPVVDYLRKEYE
ncbi:MAG: hypothetical protein AAF478_12595 [Pseudomonadota bacterium]